MVCMGAVAKCHALFPDHKFQVSFELEAIGMDVELGDAAMNHKFILHKCAVSGMGHVFVEIVQYEVNSRKYIAVVAVHVS